MSAETSKILVVSDTHGRVTRVRWLLRHETADALFFLGDGLYDLEQALTQERLQPPLRYRLPRPGRGPGPVWRGAVFLYPRPSVQRQKQL